MARVFGLLAAALLALVPAPAQAEPATGSAVFATATPAGDRPAPGDGGGRLPDTTSEVLVLPALALGFLLIGLGATALLVRKDP